MASQQPLLRSLQLPIIQDNTVTANTVIKNHQIFLENGNQINETELIAILGGADAILQHYLSSNNLSALTDHQLQDINQLFIHPITHENDDINTNKLPVLSVDAHNTLLHQLLGKDTGNKVLKIVYNEWICAVVASNLVIGRVVDVLLYMSDYLSQWVGLIIIYMNTGVVIMHMLISLLSVNKTILRYTSRTFIFWFKAFCAIKFGICLIIFNHKFNYSEYLVSNILASVELIMIISSFALIDGMKMPLKSKMLIGVIGSMYVSSVSLSWTFSKPCLITINWWKGTASQYDVTEGAASALRVLAIFMVKQTIYCVWRPLQSALIKRSITIEWT